MSKYKWAVGGDCVEGCTSPPVCPLYWWSPLPTALHEGKSQCEGAWTFNITEGYYENIKLNNLKICLAFVTPSGIPDKVEEPMRCIFFIDDSADESQLKAMEDIFRICWEDMGEVLQIKRAQISFEIELINGGPAMKFDVQIPGIYRLKSEPLLTTDQKTPRYINGALGGSIYIGKSEINEFKDTDLPRTWNRPEMSTTYYDFTLNPQKTSAVAGQPPWMP